MPKFPEFLAPPETLTPSSAGANAWETAGRRLGPLYNAAASNEREAGQANARAFKQKLWPFDILELYERQAAREAAAAAPSGGGGGGGGGIRVRGGVGGFPSAGTHYGPGFYDTDGTNQIARGAGALGNMVSDGGYGSASRRGGGGGGGTAAGGSGDYGEPYTIEKGEFVTMSDARKGMSKYNADRDEWVKTETDKLVDTQNYWDRYSGGVSNQVPYGYDGGRGDYGAAASDREGQAAWRPAPVEQSWGGSVSRVASAIGGAADSLGAAAGNLWYGQAPAASAAIPPE